ncbi:MAG TPA: Spy/CpxP family protein refolding chaperone [Sulfuriferula sp.]|nr:Spy/CpxP family protein refolding chaperone [Sulfuriferula sp.]
MMKKDTLTILMTTLLAGVLEATSAYAHPWAGEARMGGCHHAYQHAREARFYRMGKRLGLTKEQRTAVRAIVEQHRPRMRALRDAQAESRRQLMAISATGNPDTAQVRALADMQGKAIADMIVLRVQMRSEINKILTEEQRKKLLRARETRGHQPGNKQGAESSGATPAGAAAEHLSLLIEAHGSVL